MCVIGSSRELHCRQGRIYTDIGLLCKLTYEAVALIDLKTASFRLPTLTSAELISPQGKRLYLTDSVSTREARDAAVEFSLHSVMTAPVEGHRIGPYRIVRLLGQGGMGAVYEARQEPLDRRVALKTLHPEWARNDDAVARFFNEAKVLTRLEHPSIVQVSDFGHASDGSAYLVMEYLRGETLAKRLRTLHAQGKRLPVVTGLQLAWQVADILSVAHTQGIVHRDIKPDNLMMVADPIAPGGERVKVLDFGIAKLTDVRDRGAVKTDTQAVMGTPMYMSPEQCAGAGGVDAKTDVYSLGCVLYEILGGRPPFVADGAGQLVGMHLFKEPAVLASLVPRLPAKVTELVHLLLTKDKAHRPAMSEAADEIGLLLGKLAGGGPVVRSRPPTHTDPDSTRALPAIRASSTLGQSIGQLGPGAHRHRAMLTAGLAGLVIVALLAVLLLRFGHQPTPASTVLQTTATLRPSTVQPTAPSAVAKPVLAAEPAQAVPQQKPDGAPMPQKPAIKPEAARLTAEKNIGTTSLSRSVSRPPPVNRPKTPTPKAFGYEE